MQARAVATIYSSTEVFNLDGNVKVENEVLLSPLPKWQKRNKIQRCWVKSNDFLCNFGSFTSPKTQVVILSDVKGS